MTAPFATADVHDAHPDQLRRCNLRFIIMAVKPCSTVLFAP